MEEYMAGESAFEKIHVDESEKADLGGVLEQLNLPPTFVQFVRKNQRSIYIVLGIVVTIVVVWALYDSYIEKRINASSSALAVTRKLSGEEKIKSLQSLMKDFSGTESALWAKVEIAWHYIENGNFTTAIEEYSIARKELKESNPLYALVTYGLAQAQEGNNSLDEAIKEYSLLKTIKGYENIGYTGVARINEVQGKPEEAIKEFEQYLGILIGEDPNNPEKAYVTEKITRLKATM